MINKPVKRRAADAAFPGLKRKRITLRERAGDAGARPVDAAADMTDGTHGHDAGEIVTMRSEDLMGHRDKIEILHKGERYVLRLTRLGRLILTK